MASWRDATINTYGNYGKNEVTQSVRNFPFNQLGHSGQWVRCEDQAKDTTVYYTGSRVGVAGVMLQHSDAAVAGTTFQFTGGGSTTAVGLTVGELYKFSLSSMTVVDATNAKVKVFWEKSNTYQTSHPSGSGS
tara:strand:- start:141 stop:539 length:399 start_codon:yes stop_codon:yes gene_type:complete